MQTCVFIQFNLSPLLLKSLIYLKDDNLATRCLCFLCFLGSTWKGLLQHPSTSHIWFQWTKTFPKIFCSYLAIFFAKFSIFRKKELSNKKMHKQCKILFYYIIINNFSITKFLHFWDSAYFSTKYSEEVCSMKYSLPIITRKI